MVKLRLIGKQGKDKKNTGTSGNEDARAIAIGKLATIYVSDFVGINLCQSDIVAAKFDHIGNLIWQRQIGTYGAARPMPARLGTLAIDFLDGLQLFIILAFRLNIQIFCVFLT